MGRRGILVGLALASACGDPQVVGDDGEGTGSAGTAAVTGSSSGGDPASTSSAAGTTDGTGADSTAGSEGTTGGTTGGESSTGEPGGPFAQCFAGQFVNDADQLPDYDQYMPVIGSHCVGTDHQEIEGVQRVVFRGDSITVGSRPTLPQDVYRARLADMLRDHFGLAYGDAISEGLWKSPNPFTGETAVMSSGDFSSCARWGARNDDLAPPGNQLEDCFPAPDRQDTTLIVMTSGGNDVSSLAQDAIDGVPMEDLWATTEEFVQLERDALDWILAPGRFPNGVYVVYANIYEFTDGTGNVESCDVSGLAGFDQPVPNPEELTELILWANEQYMQMAVEHGVDMLFLLETFCGHGFANDDPTAPCYRGPDTPRWFDLTCIHPNPQGHGVIADEFMSIILE